MEPMRNLLLRLLDWVSSKLDRAAEDALAQVARKRQAEAQVTFRPRSLTERIWRQESLEEIEGMLKDVEDAYYPREK